MYKKLIVNMRADGNFFQPAEFRSVVWKVTESKVEKVEKFARRERGYIYNHKETGLLPPGGRSPKLLFILNLRLLTLEPRRPNSPLYVLATRNNRK